MNPPPLADPSPTPAPTTHAGWSAPVALAAGAALIGFAPIGVRLSELGPQATASWRFAFALPVLWLIWRWRRGRAQGPAFGGKLWLLLAAGVCLGVDIVVWHESLQLTTVANATLLSNMTPVIAAGFGWLVLRERVGRGFLAGAGIALCGAVLLSLARGGAGPHGGALLGDALALVTAVWYAGYLILLSRARRSVEPAAAMLVTTAAALAVALAAALIKGEDLWPDTQAGWAVLVGLGLCVHVGGQGLIAVGLGGLPITVSTVLLWIQPVAAAALGWMLFNEALGPWALAGAAMILGGIWLVQRARLG